MFVCIAEEIKRLSRLITADVYPDTEQYPYTNPGNTYPSDVTYDLWPGGFENNKENEPASKKDDEKKKWDTIKQGPGPLQTDWAEKSWAPMFWEQPPSPKTDDQEKVQDFVKSKGEYVPDDLDRETWFGEGVNDSFSF